MKKRKVLVIGGKMRIRLPGRIAAAAKGARTAAKDAGAGIKEKVSPLVRRKVKFGRFNIPVMFLLVCVLAIIPIGMVFGAPTGVRTTDITDQVEVTDFAFYRGSPSDSTWTPIDDPRFVYDDGTHITEGDYWIYFEWQMKLPEEGVAYGDYFNVRIDLGLNNLPAVVTERKGSSQPIIYMPDGVTPAGSMAWINEGSYASVPITVPGGTGYYVMLQLAFDEEDFPGLWGDLDLADGVDNRVKGTGIWGFKYEPDVDVPGEKKVSWTIDDAEDPPEFIVVPPDDNPDKDPFAMMQRGYNKVGKRMTPNEQVLGNNIYYWTLVINGHMHATLEEWNACPYKNNANPLYKCPPLPNNGTVFDQTFTITDTYSNMVPTHLRNVVKESGQPVIQPNTGLTVNHPDGLYGQTVVETGAPAYFKLYYINTAYIWQDIVNKEGSGYIVDENNPYYLTYGPDADNRVAKLYPMRTNMEVWAAEYNSVMYAPNYMSAEYQGYLTPVPSTDIQSITLTTTGGEPGFEIVMKTAPVLGKTLIIGYMTKPAPNEQGNYSNPHVVGNLVTIGTEDGGYTIEEKGEALWYGTVTGGPPPNPNKGKLIIEKYNYGTASTIEGVGFEVIGVDSEDEATAAAVRAKIALMVDDDDLIYTNADGKIVIDLPDLPWTAELRLTFKENTPSSFFNLGEFTVVLEPVDGKVIDIIKQNANDIIEQGSDPYVVEAWNRELTDYYDVALRKWVKMIRRDGMADPLVVESEPKTTIYSVKNGDLILYRIDVFNQGPNAVQIHDISDWIPQWLEFDPSFTIANTPENIANGESAVYDNSLWTLIPGSGDEHDKLVYTGNGGSRPKPISLPGWDGGSNGYPEMRLWLVLKVNYTEPDDEMVEDQIITNTARITKITDNQGNPVEDIDSIIEDEEEKPPGSKDNEIDEHHKDDPTQDEDTHDWADVKIPKAISCEVSKDTIRRTSAAFDGRPEEVRASDGLINNVGVEEYRYDVNFRSTSSLPADEFVVDDPLENVSENQVRLLALWTPVTWGDSDGRMNVWYKSKNGTGNSETPPTGTGPTGAITQVANPRYPTNTSDGWKLWKTIDKSSDPLYTSTGVMAREKLNLPAGLAANDYITALRFEYGAVEVGFTSKNNASEKLNGVQRDASGNILLPPEDLGRLDGFAGSPVQPLSAMAATTEVETEEPEGNFFSRLIDAITGLGNGSDSGDDTSSGLGGVPAADVRALAEVMALADLATTPIVVDWTPDPMSPDYAAGAAAATGLRPAQYLVECTRAMEDENIVSSAKSQIARMSLWDDDVDAVLTLEIAPFTLESEEEPELIRESSFEDTIPRLQPGTEQGTTPGGGSARTFDEMNPVFWIGMAASAIAAAGLVFLLWIRRKRRMLAVARAGRRRSR